MSTEENKATVRRLYDAIDSGDFDQLDEIIAPSLQLGGTRLGGNQTGAAGHKEHSAIVKRAFPDLKHVVHDIIAEGDLVAVRWTFTGTHLGPFRDLAPTGRSVAVPFIDMLRFENGKIVDRWEQGDRLGLLQQMGGSPSESR